MTHPLQTILFGTFTPPPSTNTIKHLIMGNKEPRNSPPLHHKIRLVMDTLTSHKWWSLAELSEYLHIPTSNLSTMLYRHKNQFNVLSKDDTSTRTLRKLYRIQPNDSI